MRPPQIVEALLFSSDAPLTAADLARADESLDEDRVEQAIAELRDEYDRTGRAFQVEEIAGGYQILSRPEFAVYLERFDTVPRNAKISGSALEALAVVAYRQPIGRAEVEEIRGVSSSGVMKTLQERGLIDIVGRGEGLGRPLLYGTTDRFLDHFGLASLDDLPPPEELSVVLTGRQLPSPSAEEQAVVPPPEPLAIIWAGTEVQELGDGDDAEPVAADSDKGDDSSFDELFDEDQ